VLSRKLRTLPQLAAIVAREKKRGRRVVLANGCFDLFHVGHVRYLEAAKARGDLLIVAVNSDSSVRALKGPGRPLLAGEDRARVLSAFACVDYVTIFKERDVSRILHRLRPDVHAKGSDYTVETVPERRVVLGYGGEIFIAGGPKVRSTSEVLKRIARHGAS